MFLAQRSYKKRQWTKFSPQAVICQRLIYWKAETSSIVWQTYIHVCKKLHPVFGSWIIYKIWNNYSLRSFSTLILYLLIIFKFILIGLSFWQCSRDPNAPPEDSFTSSSSPTYSEVFLSLCPLSLWKNFRLLKWVSIFSLNF